MWRLRLQGQYDARSLLCTKQTLDINSYSSVSGKYGNHWRKGIQIIDKQLKPELTEKLALTLQGAQSAPTFLTGNPTQPLTELNLQHYEIPDCEPLHDVKGHLSNHLPYLLEEPSKSEFLLILNTTKKVSRAVLRTAGMPLNCC